MFFSSLQIVKSVLDLAWIQLVEPRLMSRYYRKGGIDYMKK